VSGRGTIAVAMSGGLDSSVAAWILSREGPAVGLSMLLWDRSSEGGSGRCCGALDLGDARRVAAQCGIPHYTLRMAEEFRRHVVDPFVDSYLAGRTPVPCTSCNTWLKFDLFLARARGLGASRMATGHYARIVEGEDGPELHRAAREEKDQSYYLFELTQEQLGQSLFPLGERSKDEVRALARQANLVTAEKGESMELCFVAGGVREFVEAEVAANPRRFGALAMGRPSDIVANDGAPLGQGEPTYRYTVGQRRGLGVAAGKRLYVLDVRPERNQVVVGEEGDLFSRGLEGSRLHWIGPRERGGSSLEGTVRIRSRHAGALAALEPLGEDRVRVEFAEPQRGVTPGQAAVFYQGSRVLGGCWIDRGLACV
jgi:tRNA-specific 2-thiouridylase